MLNMKSKRTHKTMIYGGVILLQFGFAGFAIVATYALHGGTSHYTFAVYRNAIAAIVFAPFAIIFERKSRPKMTLSVALKIIALGILDPVMGQNLFYAGMNHTTATFTSAMSNVLPALTFIMAWILRVEKVNVKKLHSQAKILGTLVTVGGAMVMTLFAGPELGLPWTRSQAEIIAAAAPSGAPVHHHNHAKGGAMIVAGNFGYSLFYILQAITLVSYPAGLSLTAMICATGAVIGTVFTFIVKKDNMEIWVIRLDAELAAYAYGGIISSGVTYYVSGLIMREKGPVFVTAFNPLNMVIVAILSSFIFQEQLDVGKVTGAVIIVIGLYLVIWGKRQDYRDQRKENSDLPTHQELKGTGIDPSINELRVESIEDTKKIREGNLV